MSRYSIHRCVACRRRPEHGYILRDDLWQQIGFTSRDAACLYCVAKRLARPLRCDDFPELIPLNWTVIRTIRLLASGRGIPGRHTDETTAIIAINGRATVRADMPEMPGYYNPNFDWDTYDKAQRDGTYWNLTAPPMLKPK